MTALTVGELQKESGGVDSAWKSRERKKAVFGKGTFTSLAAVVPEAERRDMRHTFLSLTSSTAVQGEQSQRYAN
jgi:hypothetical protein